MLTHSHVPSDWIDLRWQRPVLPDGSPTLNPVESPISRRLLNDLQLAPKERLLAIGTRDPQFLELAAADVGRHGHITLVEPDPDRFQRARRRTAHLRDVVVIVHDLSGLHDRYDAVAVVAREGLVPDLAALRSLADRLQGCGRLVVVAFEAPGGRVASSGVLRPSREHRSRPSGDDRPIDDSNSGRPPAPTAPTTSHLPLRRAS